MEIIRPDSVVDRERADERAKQLERRRLAHDYLVAAVNAEPAAFGAESLKGQVEGCLVLADLLIAATEVKP